MAAQDAQFNAVVYQEDKHFVAQCLDVDVSSFGKSVEDALSNLREALELFFEDSPRRDVAHVEHAEVHQLTLARA
jgi:predicted RNase H-like HicB family nuclease